MNWSFHTKTRVTLFETFWLFFNSHHWHKNAAIAYQLLKLTWLTRIMNPFVKPKNKETNKNRKPNLIKKQVKKSKDKLSLPCCYYHHLIYVMEITKSLFLFFIMLDIEPSTCGMLSKCSTTKLSLEPCSLYFYIQILHVFTAFSFKINEVK